MSSNRQAASNSSGFTLIETAIVIMIIGLIIAGFSLAFRIYQSELQEKQIDDTYDTVRGALNAFIVENTGAGIRARFPCPAPLTAKPTDANFGVEQRRADGTCDDTAAGIYTIGTDAYIGAVPTRTLGISASYMLDAYSNKLTYAVSQNLVLDNALNSDPTGRIQINNETNLPIINDAPFALISHGRDGVGAHNIEGGIVMPCQGGTGDGENCDYTIAGAEDHVFKESQIKMGEGTQFYDDRLAFTLVDDSDDEWWAAFDDNPNHIHNKNLGIVCIGDACDFNDARADDELVISGGANIQGAVQAQSADILGDARITGDAAIDGTLDVTGDITGSANIDATGTMTAGADMTAGGNVAANGNITAGGNVTATGDVNGTNVSANANVTAGTDVTAGGNVTAAANLAAGGNVDASGNVIAGGDVNGTNLTATNNVTAENNVEAGNMATAAAFFYNENAVVGSGGTPGGTGPGGDVNLGDFGCADGQFFVRMEGGTAVCHTSEETGAVTISEDMITVVSNLGGNSSGLESVTVQCPNNTLRVACNGSRHPDLKDESQEEDSGLIGVRPIEPNGCQSAMDGDGDNRIVVYAICLDPNGP